MIIVRTIDALRAAASSWRREGKTVALIPTMGALHEGHLSLVRLGQTICDQTIITIFINPSQFGKNEDLESYPSNLSQDIEMLRGVGADLLFAPDDKEMYPYGFSTSVIPGAISNTLCGAVRPGHFQGVATVVTKLLMQSQPDKAIFGEKDYQQLLVIRKVSSDLDIPVEIVSAPIQRGSDGLALSSRNAYLSPSERSLAPLLYRTLCRAAEEIKARPQASNEVCADADQELRSNGFSRVDYFNLCDSETLENMELFDRPARLLAAANIGKTRLIDNLEL